MNDLISVIVPVYNVEKYLNRCVDSILLQTYKNLEIILVDDGSTDSSGNICDEYAKKDNRIQVIHKVNGGLSSARNAGLDIVNGKYISFIDSDDYIKNDMIESLYTACINEKVSITCCGRFDVYEKKIIKSFVLKKPVKLCLTEVLGRLLLWDGLDSAACDKLFKAELFEKVRFPVGKICEDMAIMYIVFENAGEVFHIASPKYYYVHRKNSITTSDFSEKNLDLFEVANTIYKHVVSNYKDLEKKADYFYILCLFSLLSKIYKSDAIDCYKEIFCDIKFKIKKMTKKIFFNKYLKIRTKLRILVMINYFYK